MESLSQLEGKKVTIWKSGSLGFGWSSKGVITEVEIGPYAQHKQAIFIHFKPYRARKVRRLVICPFNRFIVWEGYHEVDTEIFEEGHKSPTTGMIVKKSRAMSSDIFWMDTARASVAVAPFYEQGH